MKKIFQNEHSHCMCLYKQEARKKIFFASCQKTSFLAFWEHCQRHHPELFFSRILILHEKKEEKKLCEIRYDEEKKIQHSVM
jgi:hypothetical protein